MQKNEIIHSIRETARQVMPSGSRVILFGSHRSMSRRSVSIASARFALENVG